MKFVDFPDNKVSLRRSLRRICILAAVLLACFGGAARSQALEGEAANVPDGNDTIIQAHAGAALLAPENTITAFVEAKKLGVEGIETDIRMTKDHRLVLRHDDAIDRTSDGRGNISEKTLEELRSYDYGAWFGEEYAGEKLVTLEECLEAAIELDIRVLNLELKPTKGDRDAIVKLTADLVRQAGCVDRVIVSSFDSDLLKKLKAYEPGIKVAILTVPNLSAITALHLSDYLPAEKPLSDYTAEDVREVPALIPLMIGAFGQKGGSPEEILLTVVREIASIAPEKANWSEVEALIREEEDIVAFVDHLGFPVDFVNCHYNTLTEDLIAALHGRGIGVNVWTPDTARELKRVLALRPDGVITNQLETALRIREGELNIGDESEAGD